MEPASFMCDVCGRTFNKSSNFKRHLQGVHEKNVQEPKTDQHIKKEKFACILCNRQYVWEKDLRRHVNTVHEYLTDDSKLYKCAKCAYSTRYKSDLKKHANKHVIGDKVHETRKCTYCVKTFQKLSNLVRHVHDVHRLVKNENGDPTTDQDLIKEKFTCYLCERQYVRNKDLERHIKIIHFSEESNLNKCPKCSYTTRYKYNLKKHMKVHLSTKEDHKAQHVQCSYCGRTCIHKRALKYHINKYHEADQGKPVLRRKCCICSKILYGYRLGVMRSHLEKYHNIPMIWENHIFNSINDFEDWKKIVEKETTSAYVFYYACKSSKVYKCRRSGTYTKSSHNKRKTKVMGSCKINSICPSVMKVNVKEKKVLVSYLPSHVGHKSELRHLRLTTEERKSIAIQIAEQIPHKTILSSIRGSVTNGEIQRIHLTNRKDIFNIEQSLTLNKKAIKHRLDNVII